MISVFLAASFLLGALAVTLLPKTVRAQLGEATNVIRVSLILLALLALASTSYITIGTNEVGLLSRIYLAQSLPAGHIIALSGEKGPQAEILTPGFHFRWMLNLLYSVDKDKVVVVPAGQYGKLVAADGDPLGPGQTFADQSGPIDKMLDATYFLTHYF